MTELEAKRAEIELRNNARAARAAYQREWRRKNPEKCRLYHERYWQRRYQREMTALLNAAINGKQP